MAQLYRDQFVHYINTKTKIALSIVIFLATPLIN